jgi:CelD/BcsL family acetyltransferase involved in cellulose biosynthesis
MTIGVTDVRLPSQIEIIEPVGSVAKSADFTVRIEHDWRKAAACWQEAAQRSAPTVFQSPLWLDCWYNSVGRADGVEPLFVEVRDEATGVLAMLLPLIRYRRGKLSVVSFADLDLTDFNAPVLGSAAPVTQTEARRLLQAVRKALPRADLLDLRKMPVMSCGGANPYVRAGVTTPCALNGNLIEINEGWESYRWNLGKSVRNEFDRCWRIFEKAPGARLRVIDDAEQARRMLVVMDQQQRSRLTETGQQFTLDQPRPASLFHALVKDGVADGSVVLTVLETDTEIVATMLSLVHPVHGMVVTRISNAGGAWSKVSPGRLIVYKTMHMLYERGVRRFDLSIGNYDYKRRFNTQQTPLVDFVSALSWRGVVASARPQAAAFLRARPWLERRVRWMLKI